MSRTTDLMHGLMHGLMYGTGTMILAVRIAGGHPAQAATPEEWAGLYNGRLVAASEHDADQAITIYETILDSLSPSDPMRGELLYWIGHAHYEQGNTEAARAALLGTVAAPGAATSPLNIASAIRTWDRRVQHIPDHSFPDTRITDSATWRLIFDQLNAPIREIILRLRAEDADSIVRIELTALDGRRLPSLEAVELPKGEWISLSLDMSDFRSVQATTLYPLWMVSVQQNTEAMQTNAAVRIGEVRVR